GQKNYPGDARDNIARYLGVGRTTIEKAEAVVEAAEEEPEEYGHLVEQMDRSGKVAGALRRIEVLKQARQLETVTLELPTSPFQVIVADPPWLYESGNDLPYRTMDINEITMLPWNPSPRTTPSFGCGPPTPICGSPLMSSRHGASSTKA